MVEPFLYMYKEQKRLNSLDIAGITNIVHAMF